MLIIRYPLFYVIGISLYLILNFRWRYIYKHLYLRPRTKRIHPTIVPNVYTEKETALVSIVQGNNIDTMIKEGFALLGGLDQLHVKGMSVLIKPNIVNRYKSPANTNPLVIKSLIKLLHAAGAAKIFVGDMSAIFALPTKKNAVKSGIWEVIMGENITFLPFEEYGWVEVDIPEGKYIKKAIVSEVIYTVDRVINVPVIKTHSYANYSIALKNFIGAVHPQQRPYFIAPSFWDEIIAELNAAYTPHLNILDGTQIFVKGGPTRGVVATPNSIIITGDRIAADIVGLSVINAYREREKIDTMAVWQQRQIKRAKELHLGVRYPLDMKIVSRCLFSDTSDFDTLIEKIHVYANVSNLQ